MALVVPDEGERRMLEYIVNKSSPTNLTLRLYTNNVDLSDEGFGSGDFSEPSGNGYFANSLQGSNWVVSTTSGISVASYSIDLAFNFTAAVDLYGYYITDSSGTVMWAEEFPSPPFRMPSGGGQVVVRPQIQLN
jgi:hypothetical protein